jgi:hypothetical protein
VLEAVFEGTHTAALDAPGGSIPATGRRAAIPFVTVSGVADDRFTSLALYFDQIDLLTPARTCGGASIGPELRSPSSGNTCTPASDRLRLVAAEGVARSSRTPDRGPASSTPRYRCNDQASMGDCLDADATEGIVLGAPGERWLTPATPAS